ncbi:SusC/RagA family TonB-linked outer membrane protein [Hoylesella shahii]|jgi:tonB-linked outer membrane protein, susC/ragA family|uniref:SusC/RagA family TonB-linked outer membrane protein n=1 Tax=Hoylesella shahii TaxID=228603 RepID=UPI00248DBD96|nr:TonB-dependent receptor [Hoylesella shahii]
MRKLICEVQQMRLYHLLRSTTFVCGMMLLPVTAVGAQKNVIQQTRPVGLIKGSVTSDSGEPLTGVTVKVSGGGNGTVTDIDGNFSVNAAPGSLLTFSYTGFKPQTVKAQEGMQVVLQSSVNDLNEVVVVGYGTQKKANLTGAVASVNGSVLENRPISNIGQGLQGVVPNLNVSMGHGGAPGAGASFNVRGTTSLNGGEPLVLVDNVQMDANLVNPDDIESISVLKDAASAAIYGARAAYGVILITTKKGKLNSRPTVQFSASGYWQSPAVEMHNVNSLDYLKMIDIAYQNSGGSGHYFNPLVYEYTEKYVNGTYDQPVFFDKSYSAFKYGYNGNTDWWNELYKTSFSQIYNASISGGSQKTRYYVSLGSNNQGGILKATDEKYNKYNANINVTSELTPWMEVSAKIAHTYTTEMHPTGGTTAMNNTAYSGLSAYSGMMKSDLSPLMPVKHPDGHYAGQGNFTNPVAIQAQGGNARYRQNDLWMTAGVKLTPIKGLIVNADYTWNYYGWASTQHVRNFYDYTAVPGTENYYPWTNPSSVTRSNSDDYYSSFNAFAEYNLSLGNNDHNMKFMVGYNQEKKRTQYYYAGRKDLIDPENPAINQAIGDMAIDGNMGQWAVNGTFARFNYDYKGRYLLELNGRYDGSSKFKKGHRYQFFPSISAAWRISEEKFFEGVKSWWDNMKLRVSYGSLGNQAVNGNFPYLATYGINTKYGALLGGGRPVAVFAPGLVSSSFTWETVNQIDFGFDAAFLRNRLSASFDWYRRNTKDMLTDGEVLPAVLGASVPRQNAANLKTVGWELSLEWNDRLANGLSYHVKGVLSDYQSTITKFNNPTGLISQYYVGRKMNEIWGYVSNGLFQTEQEANAHANQSYLYGGKWTAGDVRFEDLDGNNKIDIGDNTLANPGDRKIIGNSTPRFAFGITAGLEYKGIDFEMFWQGIGKRDWFPGSGSAAYWGFTNEWQTPLTTSLDYWTPENTNAFFPRLGWANGGNRNTSTRYLQNASYCRLKNVTLGYTLPRNILDKIGVSRLRVYVTGENLLTFTSLIKAFDPETLNNMTYPINRKIAVGLNLTF